jgi:serine protease Do
MIKGIFYTLIFACSFIHAQCVIAQAEVKTKFVRPDDVRFDIDKGNFVFEIIDNSGLNGNKIKSERSNHEIKDLSGELPNKLIEVLIELKYLDTVNKYFPNYKSTLKLDYLVQNVTVSATLRSNSKEVQIGIKSSAILRLKSHYDDVLFTKTISNYASKTFDSAKGMNEDYFDIYYDEVRSSMVQFFQDEEIKTFLQSDELTDEPFFETVEPISINSAHGKGNDITNWQNSVVTILDSLGHGSGCIVSSDGYIVTNYHVVSQKQNVRVKLHDGAQYNGKVVRYDPECDLALVKVEASGLSTLDIATSIETGESVFVIGTPVDTLLSQSVSKGILSGQRSYYGIDYLQTDANINSGNSGGALLNAQGKLIGIVNAKYFGFGIEGIGFAIPGKYILERLKMISPATNPVTSGPSEIPSSKNKSSSKK